MVNEKKNAQGLIIPFMIGVSLLLLFQIVNVQDPRLQETFDLNLLMLGTIGSIAGLFALNARKSGVKQWFPITEQKTLIAHLGVGTIFGLVTLLAVIVTQIASTQLHNLFGSIELGAIVIESTQAVFIVGLLQPFTETIILVVAFLFIRNSLHSLKLPFSPLIATVVIILLFSGWHFNSAYEKATNAGQEFPYEYSIPGLLAFALQTDVSLPSGFPQVIMGIVWLGVVVIYESWVISFAAHSVYNLLTLYPVTINGANTFALVLLLMWVAIFVFTLTKLDFNKILESYKLKRLWVVS